MKSISLTHKDRFNLASEALFRTIQIAGVFVTGKLKYILDTQTRITDPNDPFNNCLSDSQGKPLKYAPDNHPQPPGGDGVQLNFMSLPHYETTIQLRRSQHEQNCEFCRNQHTNQCANCRCCPTCRLFTNKNQPIPINNEHELAHIYLQGYYKKLACGISTLDPAGILTIMSKAECFSDEIKKQAYKVSDDVRNKWAHTDTKMSYWIEAKMCEAFLELERLAILLPKKHKKPMVRLLNDIKQRKTPNEQVYILNQELVLMKQVNLKLEGAKGIENGIAMMAEKFSKVKVSRRNDSEDADLKSKVKDWKEQMYCKITTGIAQANIMKFGEIVARDLNLVTEQQKQPLRSSFEMMTMAGTTQCHVEEVRMKIEESEESFSAIYGLIVAVLESEDKITVSYAFHELKFEMAPFMQLEPAQIQDIEESYSKYHALKRLKQEGIIENITYTD